MEYQHLDTVGYHYQKKYVHILFLIHFPNLQDLQDRNHDRKYYHSHHQDQTMNVPIHHWMIQSHHYYLPLYCHLSQLQMH